MLESAGLSVAGEASNRGEALTLANQLRPHMVLMDGKMPLMDGLIATRYLRSLHPEIHVIAHTSEPSLANQMIALGAMAWVTKGLTEDLLLAISDAFRR